MSDLAKAIGRRIKNYRTMLELSQEKLAELAGCHPTYIGQLERGEKNATLESVEKISKALNVPLSRLFENIGITDPDGNADFGERNIPLECYEFVQSKSKSEQEQIMTILFELDKYKDK